MDPTEISVTSKFSFLLERRREFKTRDSALLDPESFDEIGEGAGVPDYNESNELVDFQPANFVLGFGDINAEKESEVVRECFVEKYTVQHTVDAWHEYVVEEMVDSL